MDLWSRTAGDAGRLVLVERDILHLRNEHLLSEIEAALEEYERLVVPWGALHLPFIERAILERGFHPTASTRHRLISWGSVAREIF
jgi:hypothetical protein